MDNKTSKKLINFYVTKEMKNEFDEICRVSGRTRTQVLVSLMTDHVIKSKPILEAHFEKLKETDKTLEAMKAFETDLSQRNLERESEMPPTIYWSDGREDMTLF